MALMSILAAAGVAAAVHLAPVRPGYVVDAAHPCGGYPRLPIKTIAPSKRQAFIQGARSVVERAETQRAAAALHLRLSNCTGFPVDQAARAIQIVAATVNRRPSALLLDLAVVELAKQQAAAASTNYDFF